MGRRGRACFCASCKCGETTIAADGTVEWFTHTVNEDGTITRVDHEGPCKTYYVDSVSGGGAESGTGTELDPWTNLNTVFSDTCIYTICTSDGCPKVKVLVKGTIDYAVVGNDGRNYLRNLVIEPWDAETITINVIDNSAGVNICAVKNCIGCFFKNVTSTLDSSGNSSGDSECYGFLFCSASSFDSCTGASINNAIFSRSTGFDHCSSSQFDNCTANAVVGSVDNVDIGTAYGYAYCLNSTFRSCFGTGDYTSNSDGTGIGFAGCETSIYYSCTGTGTSNTTVESKGFGFNACDDSAFKNCSGVGDATGDGQKFACGFYFNDGASFSDCTTSDRICVDPWGSCATFTCDI